MTLDQLQAAFSAQVEDTYHKAAAWLDQALTQKPDEVKRRVAATLAALKATGQQLCQAQRLLPAQPTTKAEADLVVRYAQIKAMYDAILSGIGINAVDLDTEPEVEAGFIPVAVVVTIGALGLTAAGVAWAIAAYEYAKALRDQSGFLVQELQARQEAMRTGKPLPESSGYPNKSDEKPKDKGGNGWGWLWALLGVGALTGAAVFGPRLVKGR